MKDASAESRKMWYMKLHEYPKSCSRCYDTKYHLVWAPKYRKWVKREDIRDKAREILGEIAENYGF